MVANESGLPLEGLRVLDLTHVIAGPFCAAILADYGAEVIKVEHPEKGERARRIVPQVERDGQKVGGLFATLNRSKKGVALDLKAPTGRKALLELAAVSDVLLENFSPGTMDRLGLGYEKMHQTNPSLIYVAISGFGQLPPYLGPYTHWGANNAAVQAMSGLMELSGDSDGPPAVIGATVGDTIPALWAVMSTLMALEHRRRTGVGQFVDVSMYDCLAAMCFKSVTDYHITGVPPRRGDEGWHTTFTSRLKCKDGYIAVSLWGGDSPRWERLWKHIGREDMMAHPDFTWVYPGRPKSFAVVKEALEGWLMKLSRWEAVHELIEMDFSAGPVQNAKEIYDCPQLKARDMFIEMGDSVGGSIRTVGSPLRFSEFSRRKASAPPRIGEHTAQVLQELLGYSEAEAKLATNGKP